MLTTLQTCRKVPKRTSTCGNISHTCRYPYWFRGRVVADLFHWFSLFPLHPSFSLSLTLSFWYFVTLLYHEGSNKERWRKLNLSSCYMPTTRDLLTPLFAITTIGIDLWKRVSSRNTRGRTNKIQMYAFNSFRVHRKRPERWNRLAPSKNEERKITFNRYISELRFSTKPSGNCGKSIYSTFRFFHSVIVVWVWRTITLSDNRAKDWNECWRRAICM